VLRVAISTVGRPADHPRVWSGIGAALVTALRARDDVDVVIVPPPAPRLHWLGRFVSFASKRAPGEHKIMWETERLIVRRMTAAMLASVANEADLDAVICLGWMPLVPPNANQRVWCFNDSTYAQRVDASPHWSHLGRHTRRALVKNEQAMLRSVYELIMASRWAGDDAVQRYGVDPSHVHIVPFGANLATVPKLDRTPPSPNQVRLMACGVEWERKGMDIAVKTADTLRSRGVEATLDVVGVQPPDETWHRPYVTYHGFLAKSEPAQLARLHELYRATDVFLFPTRDEPFGIVPVEAAVFSVPSVVPRRNALPEIVEDGVTGLLVPADGNEEAYADKVVELCASPDRYRAMSQAARAAFEQRLNWDHSAGLLVELLRNH
jgi:glycosyltransferase involved in cell wall biosynthesis